MARKQRTAPGTIEPLDAWTYATGAGERNVVVVLVYDGVSSTDVVMAADALAKPLAAEVRLVSAKPGEVVGVEPARLVRSVGLEQGVDPTALVVPGGLAWKREAENPVVLEWLGAAVESAHGVLAVSTGSLILAATGALDGCTATGHWLAADIMADLGGVPSVARVVNNDKIVTASGAHAAAAVGNDLASEIMYGR